MKMFDSKCPYCRKKDELYIKRTSPMTVLGCRRCESAADTMQKAGMSKQEIESILKR